MPKNLKIKKICFLKIVCYKNNMLIFEKAKLIATDVSARGLDIKSFSLNVNL